MTLGRRAVLHGVGFTAPPGTLTAIAGLNGSGKTTLPPVNWQRLAANMMGVGA